MKVWRTEINLAILTITDGEEPNHDHIIQRVGESDGVIDHRWEELPPEQIGEFDIDAPLPKKET